MNYSSDVMELHNEFMTAGDTLLKKAEEILKTEVKINPAKIARLEAFGFKSSKDATVLKDDKKEKTHYQKIIEAINYYRVKFPNYKFIPSETVKSICEKYGLVSGEAHQYRGFVPDKNLTEIEQFFELHPDMRYSYFKKESDLEKGSWMSLLPNRVQIEKEEYDELIAKQPQIKKSVQSFKNRLDIEIPNPIISSKIGDISSIMDEYFKAYYFNNPFITDSNDKKLTKHETKLRICAPISEMNTSGYELKEGYKLVYDPIVSIEVTHKNGIKGEIIITAWGDEASDELVMNQNKN